MADQQSTADAAARQAFIDHILEVCPDADKAELQGLTEQQLEEWRAPALDNPDDTTPATVKQRNFMRLLLATPRALAGDKAVIASAASRAADSKLTKHEAHDIIDLLQNHVQPTTRHRYTIMAHHVPRFPKTVDAAGWAKFTCAEGLSAIAARSL